MIDWNNSSLFLCDNFMSKLIQVFGVDFPTTPTRLILLAFQSLEFDWLGALESQ